MTQQHHAYTEEAATMEREGRGEIERSCHRAGGGKTGVSSTASRLIDYKPVVWTWLDAESMLFMCAPKDILDFLQVHVSPLGCLPKDWTVSLSLVTLFIILIPWKSLA